MSGAFLRPLGARRAVERLSRRLFIGATVAAPVALLIQPGLASADETGSSDLKFIEDEEGLSILFAPKGATKATWRLHRSAFGPETKFTLRTLRAGSEKGYELEVSGLTFGRRERRHLIVIFRSGNDWRIRMRSDLWCARGCEIVSDPDILFTQLASSEGQRHTGVCDIKAAFCFEVHASEISAEVQKILEGQIKISGRLLLDFDANAVWHFTPRDPAGLIALPAGLPLSTLALAWCEPVADSDNGCTFEVADNLHPLGAPGTILGSRPGDDPIFCAGGTVAAHVQKAQFRCVGAHSFSASIEPDTSQKLVFSFLRQDWTEDKGTSKQGFSELHGGGQWVLRTHLDNRVTLDSVQVTKGVLRAWHEPKTPLTMLEARISGEVASSPAAVGSRIGGLCIHGSNSSAPDDQHRLRFELHYPDAPSLQAAIAMSIHIPLLLLESDIALPGAEFSRLSFQSSFLLAFWAPKVEETIADQNGYLWLGPVEALRGKPLARLDLTRARLEAFRASDLLRLTFLFSGVYLDIGARGPKFRLASSSCRVLQRQAPSWDAELTDEPETIDTRPTLVVEFPPQHVFEEVLFRPSGADLPEVRLKEAEFKVSSAPPLSDETKQKLDKDGTGSISFSTQPADFLRKLDGLTALGDRRLVRQKYADLKREEEAASKVDSPPFANISTKLFERFKTTFGDPDSDSPPSHADQAIYIGPYGMDPDVAALARDEMSKLEKVNLDKLLNDVLKKANDIADGLNHPPPAGDAGLIAKAWDLFKQWTDELTGRGAPADLDLALLHEKAISQVLPDYAFFRDFYREQMTVLFLDPSQIQQHETKYKEMVDAASVLPTGSVPAEIEYFTPNTRKLASADQNKSAARETYVRTEYLHVLQGSDEIPVRVRARLANPSRLAFRLNCEPPALTSFHLDTLTNWSSHEMAVTPRAQSAVAFDEGGQPLPDAGDTANESTKAALNAGATPPQPENDQKKEDQTKEKKNGQEDIGMLRLLGIRSGNYLTSQERLSDVEASLRKAPGPLETAIEIPARLILSPSQSAWWRTSPAPPNLAPTPKNSHSDARGPIALWGADLVTDNPYPAVRAVHSPDLRPGFVRRGLERAANEGSAARRSREGKPPLRTTALSAPPRGPRAPWTLGVEEGDPSTSSLDEIIDAIGGPGDKPSKDKGTQKPEAAQQAEAGQVCPSTESGNTPKTHPLIEYLRRREADIKAYKARGIFRSSLDAYDRHELVLLTSAFGLPVRGRREQSGQLIDVAISSQVEPPAHFRPIDLEAGTALYRPRPLNLRELRLTALGGTLRHDTDFIPPTAARHIEHGALFDSFSIERWQHWVVLGRDVFSEVVYKGFLFPIGHRASLVKQTERIFVRSTLFKTSIRAFLRQRMFIRVGQPDKTFPALGQPNLGRQFPAGLVHILTTVTPDLVDPSQDTTEPTDEATKSVIPAPGGRLLAKSAGLVFWPRTARIAGAEVRFEALLSGAFVKLPLIFADNTATHDPDVMRQLVAYYQRIRSPDTSPGALEAVVSADHLRTLDFAGQALRYCDELKPGSATHKTLYWTLSASGGVRSPPPQGVVPAVKDSDRKDDAGWAGTNDEFDDPSLEGADQPPFYPVLETARIRLDQVERMSAQSMVIGLVRFDGYYVARGFNPDQKPDPRNPLGIYLNVINDVPFQMGSAGDRSGGLFRPASTVVALCRERGPVCGDAKFSPEPKLTTVVAAYSEAGGTDAERKTAYGNYFSSRLPSLDTKLLGVVPLSKLVQYLSSYKSGNEGLPLLREVVRYGIPETSNVSQTIRQSVLEPLGKAAAELQSRLDGLSNQLPRGPLGGSITIESIFPEVVEGLRDFQAALGKSTKAGDGADFYISLGEVYEAGQRLGGALERASVNPIERVYVAVARQMQGQLADLLQAPAVLSKSLRQDILGSATDVKEAVANAVAGIVVDRSQDQVRFLPLPPGLRKQSSKIPWQGEAGSVQAALKSELESCLDGKPPDECAKEFVREFAKILETAISGSNVDSYASAVLDALTPLFVIATRIAQALSDPTVPESGAFALLARDCLSMFAPVAEGQFPKEIKETLNDLRTNVDSVVKTIANDPHTRYLAEKFVPSDATIAIPASWKEPPEEWNLTSPNRPTLIRALYQFGIAAQHALAVPAVKEPVQKPLHDLLIGTASIALNSAQRLEEIAIALSSLKINDDVLQLDLTQIQQLCALHSQVMNSVEAIIASLLPGTMPTVGVLGSKASDELASAVRAVLAMAINTQMDALTLARSWVSRWDTMQKELGGTDAGPLITAIDAAIPKLTQAKRSAEQAAGNWAVIANRRDELRLSFASDSSTKALVNSLSGLDATASAQLTQWCRQALLIDSRGAEIAASHAIEITQKLTTAYAQILQPLRDDIYNKLDHGGFESVRPVLLLAPEKDRVYYDTDFDADKAAKNSLTPQNDQLHWDHESLATLGTVSSQKFFAEPKRIQFIRTFLGSWQTGDSTVSRIVQQAGRLNAADARNRVMSLIDFSSLREEIDDRVKKLIPQSADLDYSFHVSLGETAKAASGGVLIPEEGCSLSIKTNAHIEFNPKIGTDGVAVKPQVTFTALGELGPFQIRILGDAFNAVTLLFDGAKFTSNGGDTHCDVSYRDFKIGPVLQFLSQLSKFFTPKQGSGFYITMLSPGLEAGYGLNIGTISLPPISFFNVSLNAAARIPFDSKQATFVASLSRRDSPFTISYAPYGGSGFFALEATAQGIQGFEASFEFGGAAAFKYGPLEGYGRLMTGVYIRRAGERASFGATFYAGGTASIWIFSFGASLYVRATQADTGNSMVGEATFTFSFSLGLADYDYRVSVHKDLPGWGAGVASIALPNPDIRVAALRRRDRKLKRVAVSDIPELRADTWCMGEHWGRHSEHLDHDLNIELQDFS